jgi:hypothetical protein
VCAAGVSARTVEAMTTDATTLDELGTLRAALSRLPGGAEAVRLMARLGLWTTSAHAKPGERQPFPSRFSTLGPDELSDLSARVTSDAGRVIELVGILAGIDAQLRIRAKASRAGARSRARRNWPADTKAPTRGELDDMAEEDPAVVEVDEHIALVTMLLASAKATAEANMLFKESISREITYRTTQMQARLH